MEKTNMPKPAIDRNFYVRVTPRGQGRPRFTSRGHAYKTAEDRAYERAIRLAYLAAYPDAQPIRGPFAVGINAYYRRPKEPMNALPMVKPDLDNVVKAVLDALDGVAYTNDKNNCSIVATKQYTDYEPSIWVWLTAKEEE